MKTHSPTAFKTLAKIFFLLFFTTLHEFCLGSKSCVSSLKTLYSCVGCNRKAREHYAKCFGLLPERIRKAISKCSAKVVKPKKIVPGYIWPKVCKNPLILKKINDCSHKEMKQVSKKKYLKEDERVALYSVCVYHLELKYCCKG